jgi:hypothetical protein
LKTANGLGCIASHHLNLNLNFDLPATLIYSLTMAMVLMMTNQLLLLQLKAP